MTLTPAASSEDRTRQPLVSVVVPSYNGARFLREALDSILAQTYPNVEVLLLDDASTDETPQIAAEYEGRVTYVRQPKNLGQFDNVNDGIRRANGELIACWHSDDVYLPEIASSEVAYLTRHPEVGAVFATDIFVDAEGREYGRLRLPPEIRGGQPLQYGTVLNALLRYKNRFLVGPSAMVRASVYREVGLYNEARYRIASDLEMWMRIARKHPIAVLDTHLMRYRHFHGNATQQYFRLRTAPEAYFPLMDEYLDAGDRQLASARSLADYEAHRAEDRLMAAVSHYIKGELNEARGALSEVRLSAILRGREVQRWRLSLLTLGLWCVLRLPRVEPLAQMMHHRWHVKRPAR